MFPIRKEWLTFNEAQIDSLVDSVFDHYRDVGFPYFSTTPDFRENELRKLLSYDGVLLDDDTIKQTMHGLSLAWSYMPHSWDVVCNNLMTPLQAFNNDVVFRKVIRKRIQMGDNLTDNGIRKTLKMYSGNQSVSNFRPTAASTLYEKFLPNGGTVLDMSCGYGGRLLGAIRANHRVGNISYIGYDPCVPTFDGLEAIKRDFGGSTNVTLVNKGSEFIDQNANCDFAFTSPPYFDTEKYSDEDTQSYKKYPSQELWLNGFMRTTIENVHRALKPNCYMAINIADVKNYKNMCNDIISVAEESGFVLESTMRLSLSNSNFTKGKSAYKYEPVFVFKRV